MILDLPKNEVETNLLTNDVKSQVMGIKKENVNIILNVLRKKIYSNPHLVIVREYSSNARDAHRELGNVQDPISIILPSRLGSQSLIIQDYGIGISEDRFFNIFASYGESTKRSLVDGNKYTGGFGLGNKSFAAVYDTITVQSTLPDENGNLYTNLYLLILEGQDSVAKKILTRPAEEGEVRGTKIIIPINQGDIYIYEKYAKEVGLYWDVQPEVRLASGVKYEYPKLEWCIRKNNWGLLKNTNNLFANEPQVILDGLIYPLNFDTIDSKFEILKRHPFRLFLNTGDVNVAVNREQLDYCDKTKKTLESCLDSILKSLQSDFQDEINKCDNYYNARIKFSELFSTFNCFGINSVEYNKIKIEKTTEIFNGVIPASIYNYNNSGNSCKRSNSNRLYFSDKNPILISFEDTHHPSLARIKTVLKNKNINNCQVIHFTNKSYDKYNNKTGAYDTVSKTKQENYIDFNNEEFNLELLNLENLESYEKMKVVRTKSSTPKVNNIYRLEKNTYGKMNPELLEDDELEDLELKEYDGYYTLISHGVIRLGENRLDHINNNGLLLENLGEILVVNSATEKKLKKAKLITDTILKEEVIKLINKNKNKLISSNVLKFDDVEGYFGKQLTDLISLLDNESTKKFLRDWESAIKEDTKPKEKIVETLQDFANLYDVKIEYPILESRTEKFYNNFMEKYPLFKYISLPYYVEENHKVCSSYINLVDANSNKD